MKSRSLSALPGPLFGGVGDQAGSVCHLLAVIRISVMSFRARPVDTSSRRVVLNHELLRDVDLSGHKLLQFSSVGSTLHSVRFNDLRIQSASFGADREPSEYLDCSFDGSHIRFGPGGYARFVRCTFRNVDLLNGSASQSSLLIGSFLDEWRKPFQWRGFRQQTGNIAPRTQ